MLVRITPASFAWNLFDGHGQTRENQRTTTSETKTLNLKGFHIFGIFKRRCEHKLHSSFVDIRQVSLLLSTNGAHDVDAAKAVACMEGVARKPDDANEIKHHLII